MTAPSELSFLKHCRWHVWMVGCLHSNKLSHWPDKYHRAIFHLNQCDTHKKIKLFAYNSAQFGNMLRSIATKIRYTRPLPLLLEKSCWRNRLVSYVSEQQRWKSDEVRSYKAAILEEFNKKLTIESIKNRTKLGDGMVSNSYSGDRSRSGFI